LGRIGEGAYAKVFEVKRKSDDVICALKFVDPKTDEQRQMIINEVGIMLLCKENDGILKCYECFDHKDRLWIFLERMDGELTPMLETMAG
jgi:serine/threonine protein kinase